jgi:hypothetical protein
VPLSSQPAQRFDELLEDAMSLVERGFDLAESHARSGHDPIVVRFDEHVGPPVEDARVSGTGLLERQSLAPRLPTRPCFAGLLGVSHGSSAEDLRTRLKEGPGMSPVSSRSPSKPCHATTSRRRPGSTYQGAGWSRSGHRILRNGHHPVVALARSTTPRIGLDQRFWKRRDASVRPFADGPSDEFGAAGHSRANCRQ